MGRNQDVFTNAAYAHLHGIHAVKMSRCNQGGITYAAFTHLTGIHLLDILACTQDAITGATFAHLRGVPWLHFDGHRNDLRVIAAAPRPTLP